jgi:hypothetical protein
MMTPPAAHQQQPLLPNAQVSERDWLARAWENIRHGRPRYAALGIDEALAQPVLGRMLRAYAAQLQRDDSARAAAAEREARFGRRVQWTGFGYRRLPAVRGSAQ